MYVPVAHDDEYVQLYARLPRGMTAPVAGVARLWSIFKQLDRIYPKGTWSVADSQTRVTGVTGFDLLNQQIPGAVSAFFAMLLIVVGLVLLIACTNVASLLLARASSRRQELAVRLSLGASRRRIVRHLLAESLLLSILGAIAGLIIDLACARLLNRLALPLPIPIRLVIEPDWRLFMVLARTGLRERACLRFATCAEGGQKRYQQYVKAGRASDGAHLELAEHSGCGQLAVSIVLLATGFLFVHNLLRATSMNPGFDLHHTIWAYMRLVPEKYANADQKKQMMLAHAALDQLRALPGVESAAITQRVPLNDNCVIGTSVQSNVPSSVPIHVQYECNTVGPEYFRTIGIAILRGREFSANDRKGSQPVAIVNETFARTVFGHADPVGHTITITVIDKAPKLIIGVVADSKYFTLGEKQRLALYEPYFADSEPINVNFLIRTASSPAAYVKPITEILGRLDPTAAIETKPMNRALALALLPSQAGAVASALWEYSA